MSSKQTKLPKGSRGRKVRLKVFKALCKADILVPFAPFFSTLEANGSYSLTLLDQDRQRETPDG